MRENRNVCAIGVPNCDLSRFKAIGFGGAAGTCVYERIVSSDLRSSDLRSSDLWSSDWSRVVGVE